MLQEHIIVREFTDIYNKEKKYEIGERVFLTEERSSEMNIGKTRVVRVLDDKYSEIIRQLKDNTEEEVTPEEEETPEEEVTPEEEETPEEEVTPEEEETSKGKKKRGK